MASDPRQILAQAHQAFSRGRHDEAAEMLAPLLQGQPTLAPAIHLAGLVARAQGDLSRAEDLMRRSLALPGVTGQQRAEYANNLGNLLRSCGFTGPAEASYREAVAAFDLPQARMGLARLFLESDRADEAVAVLARIAPAQAGASVYVLLAEALAACGNASQGLNVLQQAPAALQAVPALQMARAERLSALGRSAEAQALLEPLLDGPHDAEARLALAQQQASLRHWSEALAMLQSGVERHPQHRELLSRHAALAWMSGRDRHFADPLRSALARQPDDASLRLALVTRLANAGFADESEAMLREGLERQPDNALLRALFALRCAETDREAQAQAHIAQALATAPELPLVREQAGIVALIRGDTAAALEHTSWLVAGRPQGQFAWALRVLALRQAGDAAWQSLADPGRVCSVANLQPPPGFASIEAFNTALAQCLRDRHSLQAHPLVNSVRGGTQVEIPLAAEQDPVLRGFLGAIQAPIARYIANMPDDALHPLWRRKRRGYRLSGCWTVRLRGSAGRHVSHIHPEGWISSAYYVTVPREVTESRSQGGWLSFGRPPYPIAGLEALGQLCPQAGQLALFPSYQWHGVEAFAGEGERLTLAFDVVPTG